jgi:hypothetical protein
MAAAHEGARVPWHAVETPHARSTHPVDEEDKKMNERIVLSALLGLLLTGCQTVKLVTPLKERSSPQVSVADGRVRVAPEVLTFFADEKNVTITWRLPADSRLRFSDKGIEIHGRVSDRAVRTPDGGEAVVLDRNQNEIVECKRLDDGRAFACVNRNTRPGVYKYSIRVSDGQKTFEVDPPIVNGW